MALTTVVFADVSELKVGATAVEAANAFQASEPADIRPIYAFKSPTPKVLISSPTLGSGSFSYTASNGDQSGADTDWKTLIDGTTDIVVSGNCLPTSLAVTLTLKKCTYQNKSVSMNAKNEMVVTVNFSFSEGLNP